MPVMVFHSYNPSFLGGRGKRIVSSRPIQGKLGRLYLKNEINKKKTQKG
jgi:hypothetical protein